MEKTKRNKIMLRWAILSVAITAIFWGIWYHVEGSVPVVTSIKMVSNWR